MDEDDTAQESLFPKSTGDKLREAREAQGLSLADVAGRTRVPTRHLEAIEEGRFDTMPSPTYAVGFARAYARAVGLDEKAIANEVRSNPQLPIANATDYETYQLDDPKRLPSRGLAVAAGAIALVVVIGVIIWYGTGLFRGSGEAPLAIPENTIATAPEPTPTPAPVGGGQVTLTATDAVWVKVYDASGKTLLEKTMAAGERYDVPADANNPMIITGRPDQIQVTINGSAVAPLGTGKVAIKDVPISAAALQARGTPAAAATPAAATTAPAATPTPATGGTSLPPAFRPESTPTPRPAARATPRLSPTVVPTPEATAPAAAPAPAP